MSKNKKSMINSLKRLINTFEKVMLYTEIVCIPYKSFKSLKENDLDIINMMERKGMTSYCQVIETMKGEVYFDTLVLEKDNVSDNDVMTFLSRLTSLACDAKSLEANISNDLGCEVISKITAVDVVVKLKDNTIRRYQVEEFIRMI